MWLAIVFMDVFKIIIHSIIHAAKNGKSVIVDGVKCWTYSEISNSSTVMVYLANELLNGLGFYFYFNVGRGTNSMNASNFSYSMGVMMVLLQKYRLPYTFDEQGIRVRIDIRLVKAKLESWSLLGIGLLATMTRGTPG